MGLVLVLTLSSLAVGGVLSPSSPAGPGVPSPLPARATPEGSGLPVQFYFNETGLPAKTNWSVSVGTNPPVYSNSTDSISVEVLENAQYAFAVQPVPGFVTGNWSGSFTPTATYTQMNISWRPYLLNVTFAEQGLPSAVDWGVVLNGTQRSSTTSQIDFLEPNSTAAWPSYPYQVSAVPGYRANVSAGIVSVHNRTVLLSLSFSAVTYPVAWEETGLPASEPWSVNVAGSVLGGSAPTLSGAFANGSYGFQIGALAGYHPSPSSGSVTVAGSSLLVLVNWTEVDYSLTFVEQGLPVGTAWSVTVGPATLQGASTQLGTPLPNGTFSFSVGLVAGYHPTPSSGSVGISGTATQVVIDFSPVFYNVTFWEQGLPAGTGWGLQLGSASLVTSHSPWLNATVENGSLAWTLGGVAGYRGQPSSGTLVVNGLDQTVRIDFVGVLYGLTVTETGLPAATSWTVVVAGETLTTNGTSTRVMLSNGSYQIQVDPEPGFRLDPAATYAVTIAGRNVSVNISFVAQPSTTSSSPASLFTSGEGLAFFFIVVLLLGVLSAYLWRRRQHKRRP